MYPGIILQVNYDSVVEVYKYMRRFGRNRALVEIWVSHFTDYLFLLKLVKSDSPKLLKDLYPKNCNVQPVAGLARIWIYSDYFKIVNCKLLSTKIDIDFLFRLTQFDKLCDRDVTNGCGRNYKNGNLAFQRCKNWENNYPFSFWYVDPL